MKEFFKRHKISSTLLLMVLALILYMLMNALTYHARIWKIMHPLENMIAEKYNQDDFYVEHVEMSDEEQIYLIHIVVSKEIQNTDAFLLNCHDIVEIISKYAKQHSRQFSLNSESLFQLTFDRREYEYMEHVGENYLLELSNWYAYEMEWRHEWKYVYCDELVSLSVWGDISKENISVFDKIMNLDIGIAIDEYADRIEEVVKMPNLKFIEMGNGDELSLEEKKRYAAKLHKNGINSSLWESLYG